MRLTLPIPGFDSGAWNPPHRLSGLTGRRGWEGFAACWVLLALTPLAAQELELREAEVLGPQITEFRAVLDLDGDRLLIRPTLGDEAYQICTTQETAREQMAEKAPDLPKVLHCFRLEDLRERRALREPLYWGLSAGGTLGAVLGWCFTRRN